MSPFSPKKIIVEQLELNQFQSKRDMKSKFTLYSPVKQYQFQIRNHEQLKKHINQKQFSTQTQDNSLKNKLFGANEPDTKQNFSHVKNQISLESQAQFKQNQEISKSYKKQLMRSLNSIEIKREINKNQKVNNFSEIPRKSIIKIQQETQHLKNQITSLYYEIEKNLKKRQKKAALDQKKFQQYQQMNRNVLLDKFIEEEKKKNEESIDIGKKIEFIQNIYGINIKSFIEAMMQTKNLSQGDQKKIQDNFEKIQRILKDKRQSKSLYIDGNIIGNRQQWERNRRITSIYLNQKDNDIDFQQILGTRRDYQDHMEENVIDVKQMENFWNKDLFSMKKYLKLQPILDCFQQLNELKSVISANQKFREQVKN